MAVVVFETHITDIKAALNEQVARASEIIGGMAESYAKELSRVDTSTMKNSIGHSVEDEGRTVVVGAGPVYAIYNELGTGIYATDGGRQTPWRYQDAKGQWHTTRGMRPQPFIRPSIENHISEYKTVYETELKS